MKDKEWSIKLAEQMIKNLTIMAEQDEQKIAFVFCL